MKKTIIDMKGIVKSFYIGSPNELEILHGIDINVKEGEFVSIVGQSGSGKSTLMNIIGALDRATRDFAMTNDSRKSVTRKSDLYSRTSTLFQELQLSRMLNFPCSIRACRRQSVQKERWNFSK